MDFARYNSINQWHLISWAKNINNLLGIKLYGEKYIHIGNKLALDRCPHRGASLSKGKIDKSNHTVICPYHHKCFGLKENPNMWNGTIKHSGLWYGGDDKSKIPYIKEFDDPSYRSVYITRHLTGVNALSLFDGNLDYNHVTRVHMVSFIERLTPKVILDKKKNIQYHVYETDNIKIEIENQFWLPFTNCLRFNVTLKKNNKKIYPFILFFSMIPNDKNNTTVNIRFLRKTNVREIKSSDNVGIKDYLFLNNLFQHIIENLFDILSIGLIDIPLWEDANVIRDVYTNRFLSDNLCEEDDFIQHYRNKMFKDSVKTIEYFL